MTLEEIKARIEAKIDGAVAEVSDLTGGGDHIRAEVKAKVFQGMPLIKQHRMVMDLFQAEIDSNEVHALSVKTFVME